MRSRVLCGLMLLVAGAAAIAATQPAEPHAASNSGERPRDPWVFRCVLDKRPRMVVIALHKNLWVAYDATTCSLYKAWKGDVKFQGAVYDHVHGPQPAVRGVAMLDGVEGNNWIMHHQGSQLECTAIWMGYRIVNDQVTLLYQIHSPGITPVQIEERIDVEAPHDGDQVNLSRSFRTINVPDNCSVAVKMPLMNARGNGQRVRLTLDHHEVSSELASVEVLSVGLKPNDVTVLATTLEVPAGQVDMNGARK
jgi:hypothetical protein